MHDIIHSRMFGPKLPVKANMSCLGQSLVIFGNALMKCKHQDSHAVVLASGVPPNARPKAALAKP